ncbi:MAG: DUF2330 domain-containing protein [Candidatus Tectomicrobia bacterium]|uniref:DUF2330 domain-containing protein n=1 Tax=Tectimicrobiota bacterium TaxID=2528274 RepID=A0A938B553_UNCTE|nr:DUF2330 domain-containing protein [Candidatus Tectomicrobia bacterium]
MVCGTVLLNTQMALGFCGFYVAKADTQLFNKASKVALVRHDNKTVMTMANDYRGDPQEFAVVVPVPTFLERDQIHVGDRALLDHLDAYSAPRLVEYFDEDPCRPRVLPAPSAFGRLSAQAVGASAATEKSLGVTVEARYTVGEYDIVILSAEQSTGLETWLTINGYRMPTGAARVLGSYIRQNMRFFVAKVNLQEQGRLGFAYLRPLQIAYASPKFMLPIRLGTVNADGPQDLYVFTLTRKGRVETTNYRTVQLPTGVELPVFIKSTFGDFYRALFDHQVQKEQMRVVFLEYAWDMGWCDPCAADPLSAEELRKLGVFWLSSAYNPRPMRGRPVMPQAQDVFITRLHVRYDAERFPEDLIFQETADRTNFQGRYILRHAWRGTETCREAEDYRVRLPERWEQEARALAELTGWPLDDIRKKMPDGGPVSDQQPWWRNLWKD